MNEMNKIFQEWSTLCPTVGAKLFWSKITNDNVTKSDFVRYDAWLNDWMYEQEMYKICDEHNDLYEEKALDQRVISGIKNLG